MAASETHQVIDTVFRIERARLGAPRSWRRTLVTALAEWPKSGIPQNPSAWLIAAAKRRAIMGLRRNEMLERKRAEIARDMEDEPDTSVERIEAALDDDVCDELRA